MAKKKNITAEKIIELYMGEVLTEKETSKSVYAFAKQHNFEENQFYNHFNSFEALEKSIFALFCTKSLEILEASDEFELYDTKNKLLSFYYTFFEMLSANRSYVRLKLKNNNDKLRSLKSLSKLREEFLNFVNNLDVHSIDFKNDKVNKIQNKGIKESMWFQLLITLQFWLNDESKGFEKTDVFIEKSITAQFDLIDVTPVKSVFDFAKFLWKEKMVN